jgi:hypothetical protein
MIKSVMLNLIQHPNEILKQSRDDYEGDGNKKYSFLYLRKLFELLFRRYGEELEGQRGHPIVFFGLPQPRRDFAMTIT